MAEQRQPAGPGSSRTARRKMLSCTLLVVFLAACARGAAGGKATPPCLNDCSGRGRCVNGICICEGEYAGEDCSTIIDRNVPDSFPSMTDAVAGWKEEMALRGGC